MIKLLYIWLEKPSTEIKIHPLNIGNLWYIILDTVEFPLESCESLYIFNVTEDTHDIIKHKCDEILKIVTDTIPILKKETNMLIDLNKIVNLRDKRHVLTVQESQQICEYRQSLILDIEIMKNKDIVLQYIIDANLSSPLDPTHSNSSILKEKITRNETMMQSIDNYIMQCDANFKKYQSIKNFFFFLWGIGIGIIVKFLIK